MRHGQSLRPGLECRRHSRFLIPARHYPEGQLAARGGASKREHGPVAIAAGATTTRDFELREGILIVVHATPPAGRTPFVVDVFLVAGHHVIADRAALTALLAQLPPDQHDELLHGGVDAPAPIQFHDRAPGEYTACAELRFDDTTARPFGCRTFDLAAEPSTREVEVTTSMP